MTLFLSYQRSVDAFLYLVPTLTSSLLIPVSLIVFGAIKCNARLIDFLFLVLKHFIIFVATAVV
jgi:hypothetical protein